MINPPDKVMPEIVLRMMSRAVHSTGLTNNSNGAIRPLTARFVRLTDADLTVREARLAMKSLQPSRKPAAMPRSTPTRWAQSVTGTRSVNGGGGAAGWAEPGRKPPAPPDGTPSAG